VIRRGQIYWVDFAEPRGSEPGYRHPVLVLQRDEVNASRIDTVVVCLITSNTALASAPGNTLLPSGRTGLRRPSVVNASQIATVDKEDLEELSGVVPRGVMDKVEEGLRWFLALE
jgi:mRNA interferase MazF